MAVSAAANAIIEMQVYTNGCDIVSFGSSLVESYPITHHGGIGYKAIRSVNQLD